MIIGEQDGTINFFPNTGSINNPIFDSLITNWGAIDVDQNIINTGFSTPTLYDSNGVYQLFVGSYSGSIYQYTNIDNNLNGQFTLINSIVSNIWDGGKCAIAMADINNDNQPEMIIGNLAGGISYFSSDSIFYDTTIVNINNSTVNNKINIFPNPTEKNFTIFSNSVGLVNILDIKGKIIYSAIKKDYKLKINNANLHKGVYIVKLNKNIQKLIIQ